MCSCAGAYLPQILAALPAQALLHHDTQERIAGEGKHLTPSVPTGYPKGTWWSKDSKLNLLVKGIQKVPNGMKYPKGTKWYSKDA